MVARLPASATRAGPLRLRLRRVRRQSGVDRRSLGRGRGRAAPHISARKSELRHRQSEMALPRCASVACAGPGDIMLRQDTMTTGVSPAGRCDGSPRAGAGTARARGVAGGDGGAERAWAYRVDGRAARFRPVRLEAVDGRAATLLKQEALAVGCDCAVHHAVAQFDRSRGGRASRRARAYRCLSERLDAASTSAIGRQVAAAVAACVPEHGRPSTARAGCCRWASAP